MPHIKIDMTGKCYGHLLVLREGGKTSWGKPKWLCQCDCGNQKEIYGKSLRNGDTKSCGCLYRSEEVRLKRTRKGKDSALFKHGESLAHITSEYRTWRNMINRCSWPQSKDYPYYGGRGIKVCERWLDYRNFLEDMGRKPTPKHTIERIDNNGNYEPSNCKWATMKEQNQNRRKRNTAFITRIKIGGEKDGETREETLWNL